MKKERCFYLDFIRAIAVVSILITHYNANFIYMNAESALDKVVLSTKVANIYIGDFGVSLFLIISGAALMYTYNERLELKTFYKKRFISIYPMFWIAYVIVFAHHFILNGGMDQTIPKYRLLFTLIGEDGYIGTVISTFYLIGEWFLGFIIIIYVIFPILRIGVQKYPIITIVLIMTLYSYFTIHYNINFIKNIFLFNRLPEIVFGMFFVQYIKKINIWVAGGALLLLLMNSICKPELDASFQMTYVGIASFLLLTYISQYLEKGILVKRVCQILSKYSYAIFLTHHYITQLFVAKINLTTITRFESYILFIIICCVVGFFSKLLYMLNNYVVASCRKYFGLVKNGSVY